MLRDSINDLIPQSGISDPVTQALHHQEFRPRYDPGRGTAMCRRHQRVIGPMDDQGGSRHGCQAPGMGFFQLKGIHQPHGVSRHV